MRIGFLTTEFITEQTFAGGLSNYLYRVGRLLIERGHEVHVVTHSRHSDSLLKDGIVVHRIASGQWRRTMNRLSFGRMPVTSLSLDFSYRAFHYLQRLQASAPFDILQFPNLHGCGLFASFFLPVPYVLRVSSYAPTWNQLQGRRGILDYRLIELLERIQLRRAPHIFAPSFRLSRLLREELNIDRVQVIPTPFFVETREFDRSVCAKKVGGEPYLLFFAGRLAAHKGPQILAKALPAILAKHSDLNAVFVGWDKPFEGQSMRSHIQGVCKKYRSRLVFLDPMPHSQLYPLIQGAEVVVLPSLIDNLPNACLEAMGLGAVVIGTSGSSFDEVITDGVSGFLVRIGDPAYLERVLFQVLSIQDKEPIRKAARKAIDRFAPDRTIDRLERYYSSVIASS
jgi:glycosyltransferase involved in cell wall biosynthesis